jgi:hypothetical protein
MKSSGMKRGLAVAAISAVAVTGIPALAMADTIATQVTDERSGISVELYNDDDGPGAGIKDLTAKSDGTDTTVRLEAGGGENVAEVIFQVQRNNSGFFADIATVPRNDDGAFYVEWNPATNGAFAGDVVDIRVRNAAFPNFAAIGDTEEFILRDASATTTHAINISEGDPSQKGYWQDPDDPVDYTLGVAGTTSVMSAAPADDPLVSWMGMDPDSEDRGITFSSSNSGDGTWEGVLEFTTAGGDDYDFDNPDLPPVEADEMVVRATTDVGAAVTNDDTDDFEGYTLYEQVLTGVTATLAPATEPDPGTVTVTVLDQKTQPIAGIEVFVRSLAGVESSIGFTDGRGQVTVDQDDSAQYYYANATAPDDFSPGAGDKRSNDVNNRAAVVDITTAPNDGYVPVGTTVTETVKVTDTNGDPISNRPVRIKREGPGDNSETVFKTTNDAGELTYSFTCTVAGTANIEVGISGPVIPPLTDIFQYAVGRDTVNCGTPPVVEPQNPTAIKVKLTGANKGNKNVLRVSTTTKAKGAVVRVQKRMNGKWVAIANTKELRKNGKQAFSFRDKNGNRIDKYRVIVGGTENSKRGVSNVLRLR